MGDYDDLDNPFADAAVLDAQEYNDPPEQPSGGSSSAGGGKGGKKSGFLGLGGGKKKDKESDEAGLFQGQASSSSSQAPPAYSDPNPFATGAGTTTNPYDYPPEQDDSLMRKEAELRRKEEELNVKMKMQDQMFQQQQQQLQQQQKQLNAGAPKPPNWPPCKPFLYHSIPDEIPPEHQKQVRLLYYSWFLLLFCLFCNLIGTLCILIAGVGGTDFGLSIMYFPVIGVLSFYTWYRPVYNAFMKDRSIYFLLYLFFAGWNILYELYVIIGLPDTGSSGFINVINLFGTRHIGEGVVALLALLAWIFAVGVHIVLWRQVYMVYRFRGHTIADARNQAFSSAAQTAAQSEAGREAIASAVTGAATGMMQGNQQRV